MTEPLRILSLGAGVQSTLVLLWSLNGTLPPIDRAIFADTGWEPDEVRWKHMPKLQLAAIKANVPLDVVSAGDIREDHVDPQHEHLFIRKPVKHPEWKGRQRTFVPFYVVNPDGSKGITYRTCTKTYKIEPVERKIRDVLGLRPREPWPKKHVVTQVFGISYDEAHRMKDPSRPAIRHEYPLVDMGITRDDCHEELAKLGWTAPRSACIGCPYHRNDEWRNLRDNKPEEWEQAVEFDYAMREKQAAGLLPLDGVPYIHDQRVPLDQADLGAPGGEADFGNECEGMCGV